MATWPLREPGYVGSDDGMGGAEPSVLSGGRECQEGGPSQGACGSICPRGLDSRWL